MKLRGMELKGVALKGMALKTVRQGRRVALLGSLLAGAALLVACQGSELIMPEGAVACGEKPDLPPEQVACPMIYAPVCGFDSAGVEVGTFGNNCQACAQPEVLSYTSGGCEEDRTR
ncbi:MAG: hypothetical protein LAT61_00515 [Alcanivorax sp.]|nr:hypothetical protein [Alcanivorax sp.]